MANSIILCEGSTDFALLQYYMQKVHGWTDFRNGTYHYKNQKSRILKRNQDFLTIAPSGGCSELPLELEDVLTFNKVASQNEIFERMVIITDNDDVKERNNIISVIKNVIQDSDSKLNSLENNIWTDFSINRNISPLTQRCSILTLVIPFDEDGAMETFLLNAISNSNDYDKLIIKKTRSFVDEISEIDNPLSDENYLKHRRNKTKAKFDVYFSIRTPAEQFNKRRDIIKSVHWENYASIQKEFSKLKDL